MSKSKRNTVVEKHSETESDTDFSEEEVQEEKTKKKTTPKKKSAPKKVSAAGKTAAPPVEKPKRAPRKKVEKVEEPEDEQPEPEEQKQKKPAAPKKQRKAPVPKEGQRTFQIDIDSIQPLIDRSLLKEHDDIVHGAAPLQAGRKTFTRLLRRFKESGQTEYKFVIVELTGTKKASFSYEGKRVKREEPLVVKKKDSEYTISYDFIVKATKKPKAGE
ncbi:hypothetical protein GMAR_ORF139 [Golden Marseillevirus]|uniref:hypothetical protein n=1 Tax=Golden Marseillevirus TaxID=1720526 RepID=UPI000877AE7C|nr:hypothetical protein GMAR_ORF139 [Golden Marseillevirus]ALX27513.1 hypothetical protein GMAR_ORF139 [Golden Marseillevirus]